MRPITFSEALDGYLLFAEPRLSPHTLADYFNTFRKFQDYLGSDVPLVDITVEHIAEFIRSYNFLKKKTLSNYHVGLCALWTWAYQQKIVTVKVPQEYTPPRPDVMVIEPYSETDIKAMISGCEKAKPYKSGTRDMEVDLPEGQRLRCTLILLLDTGIRVSEFCNLKVKDIDLKNRYIKVLGKGRKERQIPISHRTSMLLWQYFRSKSSEAELSINSPAFATANGRPMRKENLLISVKRLGAKVGVQNPTIHRFRHTFAINFLRNGGDIYTLQRILGHSTLDMVKRYLSIAQVDVQKAHQKASPVENWHL